MTVTVEHASAHLAELLKELANGPITITKGDAPVATIVAAEPASFAPLKPRPSGTLKGTVLYMAPDFNDTPEEFSEYVS
jgi:antitoxin (DNA-binding transcriptional repressor) of toxin-antitoxin stability system